jgi:Zn-dependent protease with chaperone function
MDFFQQQDKARRGTFKLVLYFCAAVVGIIATIYIVCVFLFAGLNRTDRQGYNRQQPPFTLWHPRIFLWSAGGALAVIGIGSLYRMAQLSGGGKAVAESLGGKLIPNATRDPDERKLLNVVEEMAIASGIPVPPVYVMEGETGINAFAAGNNPNDAVVGVTRGCIKLLKRDELQGVIGHEFSHILNGDMRMNIRLMGIVFGIVCFTVIGRELLRVRGDRDANKIAIFGLALVALGFLGSFFASLIQAAVSRQREFLADASAVQFTRNPSGLSGALQKIGALSAGSRVESPHAEEASHMFFAGATGISAFSGLATHPPLTQRIRAIDPGWDGKFPAPGTIDAREPEAQASSTRTRRSPFPPVLGGVLGVAAAGETPRTVRVGSILPSLGKPTPLHLEYAERLRDELPATVIEAARHPLSAASLIYALILSPDEALRERQWQELRQRAGTIGFEALTNVMPDVATISARARLPIVELALPALRELSQDEYQAFLGTTQWLIASDRSVDLFEYMLQRIVLRHLAPHFTRLSPPVVQFYSLRPVIPDCVVVLSALAHVYQPDPAAAARAFARGTPYLRSGMESLRLRSREECGLADIDRALTRLAAALPQIKKNVIEAGVQVVAADGVVEESEAELLRAVADALDCPIPPLVTSGPKSAA